jgi:hypothetical protein
MSVTELANSFTEIAERTSSSNLSRIASTLEGSTSRCVSSRSSMTNTIRSFMAKMSCLTAGSLKEENPKIQLVTF